MLAVMPVRSSRPSSSRAISTSKTLTCSSSRAAGAMRLMEPLKSTRGNASSVTRVSWPRWILPMSTSLMPALTSMVPRSATVEMTVPALNEPDPVTVSPSSTGRSMMTPFMGEKIFTTWRGLSPTGMPDASTSPILSRASSAACCAWR